MTLHRTSKREPLRPEVGLWRRFSRYEVANGYIRPASGAKLERFRLSQELRDVGRRRPYETLAEILRKGRYSVSDRALTPETERAVLGWCQRFGLLGVLPQQVETVVFPPQILSREGRERRMLSRTRLLRAPLGWQVIGEIVDFESGAFEHAQSAAQVMLHPLSTFEIRRESVSETWQKFFPSFPPEQSYETLDPGKDQFFEVYQEPVEEFFRAARELTQALETAATTKKQDSQDSDSRFRFGLAIHELDGLASAARLHHQVTVDGRLVEQWIAPTLLAALAMMALRDLARGEDLRICENPTCQSLYTSASYQARYCSSTCRLTVNKRTYRRNHRPTERSAGPERKGK